jgi:hypothetical protein
VRIKKRRVHIGGGSFSMFIHLAERDRRSTARTGATIRSVASQTHLSPLRVDIGPIASRDECPLAGAIRESAFWREMRSTELSGRCLLLENGKPRLYGRNGRKAERLKRVESGTAGFHCLLASLPEEQRIASD